MTTNEGSRLQVLAGWLRTRDWGAAVLWAVYLALLGVLLPHTAWAFGQFEPEAAAWLGWVAAIAFEGAIAAFTWRLKDRIEATPNYRAGRVWWRRFAFRYVNLYSAGLLVAIGVSSLANWAHSVEFSRSFVVFGAYSVPPLLYTVAFGGILPLCSLLFARILADVQEAEHEVNADLTEAKRAITDLRRQLRESEGRATRAEEAARFVLALTAEDKARRIVAAHERWPELPQAALAHIAQASPSYVSQVLSEKGEG